MKFISSRVIKPACVELCDSLRLLDISIFLKLLCADCDRNFISHIKDIQVFCVMKKKLTENYLLIGVQYCTSICDL
jgi:hypothetical protein